MRVLPDNIDYNSEFRYLLEFEECRLIRGFSQTLLEGCTVHIFKVTFNPDFTYNTGYIYIIETEGGGFARSAKYYSTPYEAYEAGIEVS